MIRDASRGQVAGPRVSAVGAVFRVLVVFDTVALLFAAALHVAGARIPLGAAVFVEPQIVPAAIVEGLAGILFAVAAYTVFAGARRAWAMTLIAHLFAIAGFLLGIAAIALGGGASSTFNDIYHRVMLVIFAVGLALLLTSRAKTALRPDTRELRQA